MLNARTAISNFLVILITFLFFLNVGWYYWNGLSYIFIVIISYQLIDQFMMGVDSLTRVIGGGFRSNFILLLVGMLVSALLADFWLGYAVPDLYKLDPISRVVFASVISVMALLSAYYLPIEMERIRKERREALEWRPPVEYG